MGALKRFLIIITVLILSLSLSLDTGYCKPGKPKKDKKEHTDQGKHLGQNKKNQLSRIERNLVPKASSTMSSAMGGNAIEDAAEDEPTAGIQETLAKLSQLWSGKRTDAYQPGKPSLTKRAPETKPKAKPQASIPPVEYPSF